MGKIIFLSRGFDAVLIIHPFPLQIPQGHASIPRSMSDEKAMLMEQLQVFEALISSLDFIYGKLTQNFRLISPILKKTVFNTDDQERLKESLHAAHHELEEFSQLIRRGQGERELLRGEILRLRSVPSSVQEDYSMIESELWVAEKNLSIREKGLAHLSELIQLLESMMRVGEMTEFDETLLTEIVTDLKNLAD